MSARDVERALRALVEELGRLAGERAADPLQSVEFRLDERDDPGGGEAWAVVATSTSGHGPESAYLIEDEVVVRLREEGRAELVRRSTEGLAPGAGDPETVQWTPGEPGALVERVRSHLVELLPPSLG